MTRKLQHIGWAGAIGAAKVEGEKVEAFCGARIYPMSEMKDGIPTCTPCVRALRAHYIASRSAATYIWNAVASGWVA